jgi:hypothetical protein
MFSSVGQIVNGHAMDFASIEVNINGGIKFNTFQEINYGFEAEFGKLRGNGSALVLGRTRGEYDFTGNMVLYKEDAMTLIGALAALGMGGFSEAQFDMIVTYSERGMSKPIVDTLRGIRLASGSNDHSRSADPLFMGFDLDMIDILYNGVSPVAPSAGGGLGGLLGGLLP